MKKQTSARTDGIIFAFRHRYKNGLGTLLQLPLICSLLCLLIAPTTTCARPSMVESGFQLLYEARFKEARSNFLGWEKANPEDPLGHAWEAASYLFEEFYRQGVLTSGFFVDDKRFFRGISGKPDDMRRAGFFRAIRMAQNLATRQLARNTRDADA
ncbi:MAG: hypothetical protein ACRELG_24730, partial [Gemmataceae bacterium]